MKARVMKKVAVAVMVLCLIATNVQAAIEVWVLGGHVNGVDRYGYLSHYLGSDTYGFALVNTHDGSVLGSALARVANLSRRDQIYFNSCFGYIYGVKVGASLYAVSSRGTSVLIYWGYLCGGGGGSTPT